MTGLDRAGILVAMSARPLMIVRLTIAAVIWGTAFWLFQQVFVAFLDGVPAPWSIVLAWLPFVLLVGGWGLLIRHFRRRRKSEL